MMKMKSEGRQQNGLVRNYMIMPTPFNQKPDSKMNNQFEYRPTVGLYTKVGGGRGGGGGWKCNGRVSKGFKSKGGCLNRKSQMDFRVSGVSAAVALGQIMALSDYSDHGSEDYDQDQEEDQEEEEGDLTVYGEEDQRVFEVVVDEEQVGVLDLNVVEDLEDDDLDDAEDLEDDDLDDVEDVDDLEEDDDEDGMSFCEVGFVVDQLDEEEGGEEGWCLVDDLL